MIANPSIDLTGIDVDSIEREYWNRHLDVVPDAELVAAAARLVAVPRRDPASSFVLHAPLELAARAALLPLVHPEQRDAVRVRIVSLVAGYDAVEPAPLVEAAPAPASVQPVPELLEAIAAGGLDEIDRAASAVARQVTARQLIPLLAPAVIPLTAAAGHAPIFLFHLLRRDLQLGLSVDLLRPLARELGRNPDWRVSWTDRWRPSPGTDAAALAKVLATFPRLGVPGSSFIHPLLMQVDAPGVADERLGSVLGGWSAAAAGAVLRVASRSMLLDAPEHAPYGWSHCLTIPQALLGITAGTPSADLGLALAATSVASFRAALGEVEVPLGPLADLPLVRPSDLATAAALGHDAHVVKHALACLDAAHDDPPAAALHLAAGQHLLDVWSDLGGDPSDPLR